MNLIRTTKTYKTVENAEKALRAAVVDSRGDTHRVDPLSNVRYVIAVAPDGRFAPALIGVEYMDIWQRSTITIIG